MVKKFLTRIIIVLLISNMAIIIAPYNASARDAVLNGSHFETDPIKYNSKLARLAAQMSLEIEDKNDSKIKEYYKKQGINVKKNYFSNSDDGKFDINAYAIGSKDIIVNGKKTKLLIITARGTMKMSEGIGDFFKGKGVLERESLAGNSIWKNVWDFEQGMWHGLELYLDSHGELKKTKNIKVLITGHSLGGAAANAFAADMISKISEGKCWNGNLSKKDVYCYTFGAINVLSDNEDNVEGGYENIHNIYNYYDSFGPNGNLGKFLGGSVSLPKSKFGHTDLYKSESFHYEEHGLSTNNHNMDNYILAIEAGAPVCNNVVKEKKINAPDDAAEYGNHRYYIYDLTDDIVDFSDAETFCENKGGYLASITSAEENQIITKLLKQKGFDEAYFGLEYDYAYKNNSEEGAWRFITGEKYEYSNWNPEKNENSYSFNAYAKLIKNGQWENGNFSNHTIDDKRVGFVCEWGQYSSVSSAKADNEKREVVLVLDVSGSMSGEPLEMTKQAAKKFVGKMVDIGASVSVVVYDDNAYRVTDFTTNKAELVQAIDNLYPGGSTNVESGLSNADTLLKNSSVLKRFVVLMSDGMPNFGKVGQDLIDYANTLKDRGYLIYTLGFFNNVADKAEPQHLMEAIATQGFHYEVDDASSLRFFFSDIADQINGKKYIYIRIACPVDVTVSLSGEEISSAGADTNVRSDFGSLTFEHKSGDSDGTSDNRVKILRLKEGNKYDIQITGNGSGSMNYTIGFMDNEGNYSDMRKFEDISITSNTCIDTVAEVSNKSKLKVDEDGDGKYDLTYVARQNSKGKIVSYGLIKLLIILVIALTIAIVIYIKKRQLKNIIGKLKIRRVTTKNEKTVTKFCKECGEKINPEDMFCNNCGAPANTRGEEDNVMR